MSDYAIGDVQGCRSALEDLLDVIRFDPERDRLWFAGDLVARGPDSLGTLRLIQSLGSAADSVLGNHDLHLIAAHHGFAQIKSKDRTATILTAPDRDELMYWLQQRPMLLQLPHQHVLTHAGLPPEWDLSSAAGYAREVERALRGAGANAFLADMYGNQPTRWSAELSGTARLRVITNYLTRMRMLTADGSMDFAYKEAPAEAPEGLTAWFDLDYSHLGSQRIIFGHWAALLGITNNPHCIATDTGCVWGGSLCAYRLDDGQRFYSRPGLQ